jgi:hypothetical protein
LAPPIPSNFGIVSANPKYWATVSATDAAFIAQQNMPEMRQVSTRWSAGCRAA